MTKTMKVLSLAVLSVVAINSYAYVNIPNVGDAGDAFLRGLNTGSSAANSMMSARRTQESIRLQRQEEALHQLEIEIKKEQLRQLKNKRHK